MLPALASLAGLSGAAAPLAGFAAQHSWLFLIFSAGLLAYANFLAFVRRQGQRRARVAVAVMTTGTILVWSYNFLH